MKFIVVRDIDAFVKVYPFSTEAIIKYDSINIIIIIIVCVY